MRPIDQKLKYQVDKVIRLAATGGAASDDPMRFKANPDSLESKVGKYLQWTKLFNNKTI